jgi:hypothetical protein
MKLLLENWRKYLLDERKTDILYNKIGEYFMSLLEEPNKYFNIMDIQADREYEEMIGVGGGYNKNTFYALNAKKNAFNEQEFERYQQITGDTQIMPALEVFQDAMKRFKVEAWAQAERPSAGADMSAQGTMRVYFKEEPKSTSDFITQSLKKRSLLMHELGHWLNAIRSGYKNYRTSGKGRERTPKEFDSEADAGIHYARSTEEMQARVTDIFDNLKDKFTQGAPDPQYLQSIKENNPRLFLRIVLAEYGGAFHVDQLDKSTERRLINRILQMFNFFKENRDDYPALETLPETPIL